MRVLRRSADELVIEDRGWLIRLSVLVFAGIGLLVLLVPRSPGFMNYLMGSLSFLLGATIIILPRVTTIRFDRIAGTAALHRAGLVLPEERRTVALTAIQKVEVEGSTDSDGGRMFRISMDISGEDPMRFTTYSSSGKADKQDVADAVRDWLARKSE